MNLTMSVEDAAKIMNCTPMFIRCGLRNRQLPIGSAVQMHGENKWRYHIVTAKVYEYMGIENKNKKEVF